MSSSRLLLLSAARSTCRLCRLTAALNASTSASRLRACMCRFPTDNTGTMHLCCSHRPWATFIRASLRASAGCCASCVCFTCLTMSLDAAPAAAMLTTSMRSAPTKLEGPFVLPPPVPSPRCLLLPLPRLLSPKTPPLPLPLSPTHLKRR
jgi:hypothetical protein